MAKKYFNGRSAHKCTYSLYLFQNTCFLCKYFVKYFAQSGLFPCCFLSVIDLLEESTCHHSKNWIDWMNKRKNGRENGRRILKCMNSVQ